MMREYFTLSDLSSKKVTESFTLGLKIQFFLRSEFDYEPEKPLYGSHIYKIGKKGEWQERHYKEEDAKHIPETGFSAAAYYLPRRDISVYERLISWGVTEFTEDHHISIGLNW